MHPRIVDREAYCVLGVLGHFPSAGAPFGPLWQEFVAISDTLEPFREGPGHYGVYLGADHSQPLDYLAGLPVGAGVEPLKGAVLRQVPAAQYAVLECDFGQIGETYGYLLDEWLPQSAYEQDAHSLGFDYYPPGMGEGDLRMEIWLAVRRATD